MHSIMDKIMNFSVYLIDVLGYPGLFVAGALEFVGLPVSGEVLIPLAGFMVKKGHLNFILSFIILNLGSILATLAMYAVGYYFNNWAKNLMKRKLYKNEEKLNNLSDWFKKNGPMVSFLARFIPFIRVYVSLIAGIERVPVVAFTIYSSAGIIIWNAFFFVIGYYLGDYKPYLKYLTEYKDILLILSIVLVILIIGIILLIKKRKNKR
ncbi:MAG: DedA family protein [Sarcina sp.]